MKRIKPVFFCGFLLLLGAAPASAQTPAGGIDGLIHDGWFFRGSTRADAEARMAGPNGTALVVDCQEKAPRVMIFFRNKPLPAGSSLNATTTKNSIELTFHFLKRGVASGITSYFDKDNVQAAFGELISSGRAGEPVSSEHVNFVGAQASGLLAQLKSMDSVSAGAQALGQPLTFELKGAAPMIDRVLAICSAGP
jgi:hypothetical protein